MHGCAVQTVGSCCCFCGLALRDTRYLSKQCCPPSPVWIIMKTQYTRGHGPAGPFSHQACWVVFQPYSKHSQFGDCLNHPLQRHHMKVRASIKSLFFFHHHGTVTQIGAVVIPGCLAAGAFHQSAEEKTTGWLQV